MRFGLHHLAVLRTELVYIQKIPALSDTDLTNWVISTAPDVYLYGSLLHSAPYLAEDPRVTVWAQLYGAAVQRLNQESDNSKYSGTGLATRIRGLDTSHSATFRRER